MDLGRRWSNPKTAASDVAVVAMLSVTIWRFGDSSPAGAIIQAIGMVILLYLSVRVALLIARGVQGLVDGRTSDAGDEPADDQ